MVNGPGRSAAAELLTLAVRATGHRALPLLLVWVAGAAQLGWPDPRPPASGASQPAPHNGEREVRYLVPLTEITVVLPPDMIPALDDPSFVSVEDADHWMADDDLSAVLTLGSAIRVYPFKILVAHEIVNDSVAGTPVLVTYCPLCGSALAFERRVEGEAASFGTSGRLYNSNLVMYDRKTRTLWTQIAGEAIIGVLAGQRLTPMPIQVVPWHLVRAHQGTAQVLSRETGLYEPDAYLRGDPYAGYDRYDGVTYPVQAWDGRTHAKTVVYGIAVNGAYKAYPASVLAEQGVILDRVNDTGVRIERDETGVVTVTELDSGTALLAQRQFWFAWYAFFPTTDLYSNE